MEKTTRARAELAAQTLLDKKARDVVLLDVSDMTIVTEGFLLASGTSPLQVKALADAVEEKLQETEQLLPTAIEGYAAGRWIVLDYPGLLVHIFHREDREFYNLERLWDQGTNRTDFQDTL